MSGIKFVHTNLVAKDWKALAKFYVDVFGCRPIHPERNLSGEWLGKTTGVPDARLRGVHLALPGYENGPALEIFQYEPTIPEEGENRADRQGFRHIAFHVESPEAVRDVFNRLVEHGGKPPGEIVRQEYEGIGLLTVVHARDPEGNIVEIQNWG